MINTIIFDFGNVFINLDIEGATKKMLDVLKIDKLSDEMIAFNSFYEQGLISTDEFLDFYSENFKHVSKEELIALWNLILKDFPKNRLEFIQNLKQTGKYKLILLSNTNELHINWIKAQVPFYNNFKSCFDAFYLSHLINLRKPNTDSFEFVLKDNNLSAKSCLFIDDNKDNIDTANAINIKTWLINPKTEDVIDLFKIKKSLF